MISPDVGYALSAALAAGNIGTFFAGRKAGQAEAEKNANEAQSFTIRAQAARIDVLESEKGDLQKQVDHLLEVQKQMQIQLDLLRELVLRGNPVVVPPGVNG